MNIYDAKNLLEENDISAEFSVEIDGRIASEEISSITYNSRDAVPGTLFFCKGETFKPAYLTDALERGAFAYVSEVDYSQETKAPGLIVSDIRKAMAVVSVAFFDVDNLDLKICAFTGTKGKTTAATYMKKICDAYLRSLDADAGDVARAGVGDGSGTGESSSECGCATSIETCDGRDSAESVNTTPEVLEMQRLLRRASDNGSKFFSLEVSSQALKYDRTYGVPFDTAAFLNISEDHISPIEHPDFDDYFESKLRMFSQAKCGIVNLDCDKTEVILARAKADCEEVRSFSRHDSTADYYAHDIVTGRSSTDFRVRFRNSAGTSDEYSDEDSDGEIGGSFDERITLGMIGDFNVENALAVIASAHMIGIPMEYIKEGLKESVGGHMEVFTTADDKITVIVDYAHNKLSFETLFSFIKENYPDRADNIVCVFGCVGGKAYQRRKELGELNGREARKLYITAYCPDDEPFEKIAREIAEHVEKVGGAYEIIEDRGEAIQAAIAGIDKPAVLIVAGRGRENWQKYHHKRIPMPSDVELVEQAIAQYVFV